MKNFLNRFRGPQPKAEKVHTPLSTFESKLGGQEPAATPRLSEIFANLRQNPELLTFVAGEVFNRAEEKPARSAEKLAEQLLRAEEDGKTLEYAKLIDRTLGEGTFRKMSFIVTGGAAEKNVLKILKKDLHMQTFGHQVEKGLYLSIKEEYGVEWDLEKASRDVWQNFFDGNGGTLDGIETSVERKKVGKEPMVEVCIKGPKGYDWRELVHLGGTTKQDSETDVGGFGEGTKILSLVLLRDFDAKSVTFSANDWELDFYLDQVPEGSYTRTDDRGLFARKRAGVQREGNELSIVFPARAERNARALLEGRELFYSKDNEDFKNPDFNNSSVGGFKILPHTSKSIFDRAPKGHLYIAGQRMHFDKRDEWKTVEGLQLWTWKKTLPRDRDRGMVTRSEVEHNVIKPVVASMTRKDAERTVYAFKPHWDGFRWTFEIDYKLLQATVAKLAREGAKLMFDKEYIANDLPNGLSWIGDHLKHQGNKLCPSFMSSIGMTKASERFLEWQNHIRVEANGEQKRRMQVLMDAARAVGLESSDLKEVWLFNRKNEKSTLHGQYNDHFFWMADELFSGSFLEALHTYVHEAAHKDGPHGNAKFDYTLQNYLIRIQQFVLNNQERYREFEQQWKDAR